MILVDTNVILDIVVNDPVWADWSQQQLERASLQTTLCINSVIYAELSIAFDNIEALESALKVGEFRLETIPREAFFLAGKAFVDYRRKRGTKAGVLPDFFIGAHAAVARLPLLTRDTRRYATYFPSLELIVPPRKK
ncbi:MAG: type II toxin-antitoxin system VapC family toxin [Burkholderiales bacterium]